MLRPELELQLKTKLSLNLLLKNNVEILAYSTMEFEDLLKEETISNPFIEQFEVKVPKSLYFGEDPPDISNVPYIPDSLRQLEKNVRVEFEGENLEIALDLIYNTDERGFLKIDIKDIAEMHNVDEKCVEDIRKKILRLEPVGVCSKDIYEFMKIQAEELFPDNKEIYIDAINKLKSGRISKDVKELLKSFKRYPLGGVEGIYKSGKVDAVIEIDDGNLIYFLYEDFFNIRLREEYIVMYENAKGEVKKFLREMMERINVYNRILNLRRETMKQILEEIVTVQKNFLIGEGPLKSLMMKDLSKKLQISESTLSRIASSKYVKTPVGTYPIKFFFVRSTVEGISQEELMKRIREIIEREDKRKPLSDEEIAKILKREGFNTARRTVAKYRDMLGIPGSRERKIR